MNKEQNACGNGSAKRNGLVGKDAWREIALPDLQIGGIGEIVSVSETMRGRKKLADVGLIPGAKVEMEARAPFGSLLRICLLGTSIAISVEDALGMSVRVIESDRGEA